MVRGDIVKFAEVPFGHYFWDNSHLWESVRSGDIKALQSSAPDHPVMRCRGVFRDDCDFKVGEITIDYFNADFRYLGDGGVNADEFIIRVREYLAAEAVRETNPTTD